MMRRLPAMLAIALLTAASAGAQVLTVNGHAQASVPAGRPMVIELLGPPGQLASLGLNVDPGPSTFAGVTIPLGLGDGLLIAATNVPFPASGHLGLAVGIPNVMALEGIVLYAAAIIIDPASPSGILVSNQAVMRFTRLPEAGPDNAGFVGDPISLDAADTFASGPLPAGFSASWSVVQAPAGASPTLGGAATAHPTLVTDTAGFYRLAFDLLAPGTTGGSRDTCEVHVFDADTMGLDHGDFFSGSSITMNAQVAGPNSATHALVGLDASASGALTGTVVPGASPTAAFTFASTSVRGDVARRRVALYANAGRARTDAVADALGLHLKEAAFDGLETLIAQGTSGVDLATPLNAAIGAIPPIPVANIPAPFPPGATLFSATIQPTGIAFDPGLVFDLQTVANALRLEVTLTNVVLTFDVNGLIFNAPYMDVGTLTVPTAVIGVDLTTQVANGVYTTTASNASLDLQGATLSFQNGVIPSTFANGLLAVVTPALEAAVGALVAPILPPLVDGVLNAIPTTFDLGGVELGLTTSSIAYATTGLTLGFAVSTGLTAPAVGPEVTHVFHTPGPLPTFGALAPNGSPFIAGLAASDDLINQVLAEATRGGLLQTEVVGALDFGLGPVALDAQTFALLFPNLGFDRLAPTTPIRLRVAATMPPLFLPTPSGAAFVQAGDLELAIEAEIETGYWASMTRIGLEALAQVTPVLDPMTGTLSFLPGTVTVASTALTAIAGVDAAPALVGLDPLLALAVQSLLASLPPIALPTQSFGITGTLVDLTTGGPGSDHVTLYVN